MMATEPIATVESEQLPTEKTDTNEAESVSLASFIADALRSKNDKQPWYQQSNTANHNQKPGRPPHGTRRSMGKR